MLKKPVRVVVPDVMRTPIRQLVPKMRALDDSTWVDSQTLYNPKFMYMGWIVKIVWRLIWLVKKRKPKIKAR